jgi:hypothetical protein
LPAACAQFWSERISNLWQSITAAFLSLPVHPVIDPAVARRRHFRSRRPCRPCASGRGAAALREVALELLARVDAIAVHAQTLDDANAVRVETSRALASELEACRALGQQIGVHVPNHQQLLAMGSRAERTSMAQTPFAREVGEAIAPNERRNHASYANGWRDQITKAARAVLSEPDKEEAA